MEIPTKSNAEYGFAWYSAESAESYKSLTISKLLVCKVIQYGASLRQLSRLTGISYGVIQRINGKMKVGQLNRPADLKQLKNIRFKSV